MGVGSGGTYALAAALALVEEEKYSAEQVARKAMKIAGDICVYTNHNLLVEVLDPEPDSDTDNGTNTGDKNTSE